MVKNETKQYVLQLLSDYERGLYTRNEVVSKVHEIAAAEKISDFVEDVPMELLQIIKFSEGVVNPEQSPEDIFLVHYNSNDARNKVFLANISWHKHFYP
jgi:hypothetical protein